MATTRTMAAGGGALWSRHGGRTFLRLWLGQTVSAFGSHMSGLALGVWLFQRTGSATPLALTFACGYAPSILLGPYAGALVDRLPRKVTLVAANAAQAAATLAAWGLLLAGQLPAWGVYLLAASASAAGAFGEPALEASVVLLVPPAHLGRANGLQSLGNGLANLLAPVAAGLLVARLGIATVLLADMATFLVGALAALTVAIPNPAPVTRGGNIRRALRADLRAGWRALRATPGLTPFLLLYAAFSFTNMSTVVLLTPTVLARGGDAAVLGLVFAAFGAGGLVGGAAATAWRGPRARARAVCGGIALSGLLSQVLFGLASGPPLWLAASFANGVLAPLLFGYTRAVWQASVAPAVQGRVFAWRTLATQAAFLAAGLLAGPLADRIFRGLLEPAWGLPPGGGYSLMFVAFGALSTLVGLASLASPAVRALDAAPVAPQGA